MLIICFKGHMEYPVIFICIFRKWIFHLIIFFWGGDRLKPDFIPLDSISKYISI